MCSPPDTGIEGHELVRAFLRKNEGMIVTQKFILTVTGVTCGHCVAAVTRGLTIVPGVSGGCQSKGGSGGG